MIAFKTIRARAAKRKGGEAALASLLPKVPPRRRWHADGRPRAGGDGQAHLLGRLRVERDREEVAGLRGGVPRASSRKRLAASSPTSSGRGWPATSASCAIRRRSWPCATTRSSSPTSPASTAASASFSASGRPTIRSACSSCWPSAARASAARTGQYFLRFIGKDCFITSADMVACLRDAGLDIAESPTSKKDLRKIQDQFNAWAKETGLPLHPPLAHLRHVDRRELRRRDAAQPRRRWRGVDWWPRISCRRDHGMNRSLSLLFVCQGNTCRSPMAAALAQRRWSGCKIQSAGISVLSAGQGAAYEAAAAMRRRGIDIGAHKTTSMAMSIFIASPISWPWTGPSLMSCTRRVSTPPR